jgi:hypothetical protein
MSTYSINAVLNLSGEGVSSDKLSQNETQILNIIQPTVQSGAFEVPGSKTAFSTFDGVLNLGTRFLYLKNTGGPNNGDITLSNQNTSIAVAFVQFTGLPTTDKTIKIISTDGTEKTYTAKGSENTGANQFINTGSAAAVANSLEACIEASAGHAGKISVSNDGAGKLVLTQVVGGTEGNTTITSTLDNATFNSFVNGGKHNITFGKLTVGQWMAIPIDPGTILNIQATVADTPCEYGWWTLV